MPRAARIAIFRDKRNTRLPHAVNIPKSLSATGERQRPHFPTRAEAERHKAAEERRLHAYSEKSYGLTDAQKIDAAEVLTILARHPGRTMRDAAHLAVRVWDQEQASLPLPDLAGRFEAHGVQDGLSQPYRSKSADLLNRFAKSMPHGSLVSGVHSSHVDGWLRSLDISPVTRNNYRRHLSAAFGYAIGQGWIATNPCAVVKTLSVPDAPVRILSPDEARRLLAAAGPKIVAWFALGLFAGLRPTEAKLLAYRDIGDKFITMHGRIAKTRQRRLVPVTDQLRAWLALAEPTKLGTVGHPRLVFEKAADHAGLRGNGKEWPADCLRHSFASYRLTQTSATDLARDMGNSESVLIKHYREVATPAAAAEFFSIFPTNTELSHG